MEPDDTLHPHTALERIQVRLDALRHRTPPGSVETQDELNEIADELARLERHEGPWTTSTASGILTRLRALEARFLVPD